MAAHLDEIEARLDLVDSPDPSTDVKAAFLRKRGRQRKV